MNSPMSKINWKGCSDPRTLLRVGRLRLKEIAASELPIAHVDGGWGCDVFWPPGARWRGVIWLFVIFGGYAGAALLFPYLVSDGVALLWLPNAVLVTALLRFRQRDWPYVYAVGLLAEVVGDLPFGVAPHQAFYFGVVNAIEATLFVLCAGLIAGGRRHIGLLSVRSVSAVVLASVMVPALTGLLGAIGSVWTFDADYLTAWRTWWFGDSLGILVGVPVCLLLRDAIRSVALPRPGPLAFGGGGAAVFLFVVAASLSASGNAWGAQQTALAAAVLLSLTFGAVGAPTAAVLTTTVTLIGLAQEHEGLAVVVRDQTLLFVVFGAIYAIAGATESADQAMRQLTRSRNAERERAEAEAKYHIIADNAVDVVLHLRGVRVAWVSPSVQSAFGDQPQQWIGSDFLTRVHPDDVDAVVAALQEINSNKAVVAPRFRVRAADGNYHWVDGRGKPYVDAAGNADGAIGSMRIVDEQVEAQRQLERLAHFDVLTGLVNRAEAIARLTAALESSRSPGPYLGVLFCDVDHFKQINDTWGHNAGDIVLTTLAARISETIRHGDTAGRTGGDELLVLLPGAHSLDEVTQIAEKIRSRAAEPIHYCGNTILATLSIGATLAIPGESVTTLTARADAAMYEAKNGGGNTVAPLSPARPTSEALLRAALAD